MACILGGRVTAQGEKIGLSHGSGQKHRGPEAWFAGRKHAGLGGRDGEVCPVCCGFRGSPAAGGRASVLEENRSVYLLEESGPQSVRHCASFPGLPPVQTRPRRGKHSDQNDRRKRRTGSWPSQGCLGPCVSSLPFLVKTMLLTCCCSELLVWIRTCLPVASPTVLGRASCLPHSPVVQGQVFRASTDPLLPVQTLIWDSSAILDKGSGARLRTSIFHLSLTWPNHSFTHPVDGW